MAVPFEAAEAGAAPRCLSCHRAHYVEHGSCVSCHRGNDRTTRKDVAHDHLVAGRLARHHISNSFSVARGKKLLATLACRRCHTVGGTGNRLASNLDHAAAQRPPQELERSTLHPAEYMPDFRLTERDATDVVNALLAGRAAAGTNELPLVLRFKKETGKETVFMRKCGGCHRALTQRHGPQGLGDTAPNLSGIFSSFYPATYRGNLSWTPKRLETWIRNPRGIKPASVMPPVALNAAEKRELQELLRLERKGH